jgi:hypothetical protein
MKYLDDPVDIIVISKPGEEKIPKPILLFCQGSLPQPVVKYDETGLYGILPFDKTAFLNDYHIVIVGKPFIPIISNVHKLGTNYMFLKDKENEIPPKGYIDRNYLDYYVFRNNSILKQLFKERWVKTNQLLVAGHSEGSTVAVKMASLNKKITQLIYSGGNPYGRITTILAQSRCGETDSLPKGQKVVDHWKNIVADPAQIQYNGGNTFKATYSFSLPQRNSLMQLKIPVLITYGTEDWSVAYNDLFQIEAIQQHKRNITFKSYMGLEHSYFPKNGKGEIIEEEYNWDKVARDWMEWLKKAKES